MERKVCYIINFYLGDRRYDVDAAKQDKLCYLKSQIECLTKYKHSLSKIIFNFNLEHEHGTLFIEALKIVPQKVQNTPIEIYIRENYGMSYGAWSDHYIRLQDQYDYFIFNEDDYFIVEDNFDEYLVNKFNSLPNCGYLCGLVRESSSVNLYRKCAGMSSGISSNDCLKKVIEKYGELPHSKFKGYSDNELNGQIYQTAAICEMGYEIYDIREEYRLRFHYGQYIDNHFMWNDKDFFIPAKIYYNELYPIKTNKEQEYLRMENNINSEKYFKGSVCYIINFYFGDRRFNIDRYNTDKLCYLKGQLECLEKYKHSLSKIIFNFNVEPEHYQYLSEAVNLIPKTIQQTNVEINIRQNYGMSYGAFSDAFAKYMDKYDYYIFNEDDYMIVQDNFDEYLVNKFNSLPNCGYLCGLVREIAHYQINRHAGMSSGISSYECLKKVFDQYGELPHSKGKDYETNEKEGQTPQTSELIKLGYDIYDIREDYRQLFWTGDDTTNGETMVVNVHFMWHDKNLFLPAKVYFNEPYKWTDRISPEFLRMECDYNSTKYFNYDKI